MSGSNYFYCSKCMCKSVYSGGDEEDDNVDVETGDPLPDGNVGRMVLLCKSCAKKYTIKIEDRAIIQQKVQPDKSGTCFYPKAFIVCSWFESGLCKSPDGICRST